MAVYNFGTTSARHLVTLVQPLRLVLIRALDFGVMDFSIISGRRTLAEQHRLYSQGRTEPGPIVTWTLDSRHLSGEAFDVAPYPIDWDDEGKFHELAGIIKVAAKLEAVDLVWGYDLWGKDMPHFELRE